MKHQWSRLFRHTSTDVAQQNARFKSEVSIPQDCCQEYSLNGVVSNTVDNSIATVICCCVRHVAIGVQALSASPVRPLAFHAQPPPMQRLLAVSFAVCAIFPTAARAQSVIVHPTEENLRSPANTRTVTRADTVTGIAALDNLARQLRSARVMDSIGAPDGDGPTGFGMIRDVTVLPDGRVAVIDRANSTVRMFDYNGTYLLSFGRDGGGPTDLRTPISAWAGPKDQLAVYDVSLGLKFLQPDGNGGATLAKLLRVNAVPTGVCSVGNRIFALSPSLPAQPGATASPSNNAAAAPVSVRVFDADAQPVGAFGEPYKSSSGFIRFTMSEGEIGCASDGTVVTALSKLPFVQGYTSDGDVRWTLRMTDFQIGRHLEQGNERGQQAIGLDPQNPTNSFTLRLREVSRGMLLVQVGLMTPKSLRDRTMWERIDSYLVETSSGRGVFVSSSLPLVAGGVRDRVFGFSNDPYPRVLIMRLPGPAGAGTSGR